MIEYFKKIYNGTVEDFYNLVFENLKNNKKMFIITANTETLVNAEENVVLKNTLLKDSTTVIADGIGIIKGAKILKHSIKEIIPGVELSEKLLKFCNESEKSIYLFGAKKEVIKKFVDVIKIKYPKIIISGFSDGYIDNKQEVFSDIAQKKPDVVLVALGVPMQELLISENIDKFEKGIFVGVGGSFDVLSGTKKRAPKTFRNLKLEWLYRIIREPKRIGKFVKCNYKYVKKILEEKCGRNVNND